MATASSSAAQLVSSEILIRSNSDGVLRLTLVAQPANTLSDAMLDALQQAIDDAVSDKTVRVIIIAAAGKIFCAGHDMRELTAHRQDADGGRAYYVKIFRRSAKLMQSIVDHPRPVIAEIDGLVTAAGTQLVASCDLAIATDRSAFCTPGVNIGLFCSTPMVALSRNVHRKHAMEMLLTGETIDAGAAREIGLINRVVPPDYLNQVVSKYAETIASKPASTVKIGKKAFYRQAEMNLSDAYDYAAEVMAENMMDQNAEEGIGAFIEKRDPEWSAD